MGKFLRLFFGCHARSDRSFFWHGKQFPICARCTGELCGMLMTIPIVFFWGYVTLPWCLILTVPLLVDGILQLKTKWVSNNPLRLITGILFGIAVGFILVSIHIRVVRIAVFLLHHIDGNRPYYDLLLEQLAQKAIF